MAKTPVLAFAAALLIAALPGCDYARMSEQESIETYEATMPEMPEGTLPAGGGSLALREADPAILINPLPPSAATLERGEAKYNTFCDFCHGAGGDGRGPVSESFIAPSADLRSERVQDKSDGELFKVISFGRGRMPALAATIAEGDLWAIIYYLRTLSAGSAPEGGEP